MMSHALSAYFYDPCTDAILFYYISEKLPTRILKYLYTGIKIFKTTLYVSQLITQWHIIHAQYIYVQQIYGYIKIIQEK